MMPVRRLVRYLARHRGRYAAGVLLLLATNACALLIPWVTKDVIDALGDPARSGPTRQTVVAGALLVVGARARPGGRPHGVAPRPAGRRPAGRGGDPLGPLRRLPAARARVLPDPPHRRPHVARDERPPERRDARRVRPPVAREHGDRLRGYPRRDAPHRPLAHPGGAGAVSRCSWAWPAATPPASHAEALAVQEQLARLSDKAQENLSGMAVVRAYTLAPREIEEFDRLNREHLARVLRQARTQGLFAPLLADHERDRRARASSGSAAGPSWRAGCRSAPWSRSPATSPTSAWPTMALGWVLAIVRRGLAAFERVTEILDARPGIVDGPERRGPGRCRAGRDRAPAPHVPVRAGPPPGARRREPPDPGRELRRDRGADGRRQDHAGRCCCRGSGIRRRARSSSTGGRSTRSRSGDLRRAIGLVPAGGVPLLADASARTSRSAAPEARVAAAAEVSGSRPDVGALPAAGTRWSGSAA